MLTNAPTFESEFLDLVRRSYKLTVRREFEITNLENPWQSPTEHLLIRNGLGQAGRFYTDDVHEAVDQFYDWFLMPRGSRLAEAAHLMVLLWRKSKIIGEDDCGGNQPFDSKKQLHFSKQDYDGSLSYEFAHGKPRFTISRLTLQEERPDVSIYTPDLDRPDLTPVGELFVSIETIMRHAGATATFGVAQEGYRGAQAQFYADFPCKRLLPPVQRALEDLDVPSVRIALVGREDTLYPDAYLDATWIPYGGWFPVVYGARAVAEPKGEPYYSCMFSPWVQSNLNREGMPIYPDRINKELWDAHLNCLVTRPGEYEDWDRLRLAMSRQNSYYLDPVWE